MGAICRQLISCRRRGVFGVHACTLGLAALDGALSCQAAVQPGGVGCEHCHHSLSVLTIRATDDSGKVQGTTIASHTNNLGQQ
jgi:hypothetical protein